MKDIDHNAISHEATKEAWTATKEATKGAFRGGFLYPLLFIAIALLAAVFLRYVFSGTLDEHPFTSFLHFLQSFAYDTNIQELIAYQFNTPFEWLNNTLEFLLGTVAASAGLIKSLFSFIIQVIKYIFVLP